MRCSAGGRAALIAREGLRLRAYLDSRRIATIGVGHTGRAAPPPVRLGMTITRAQADAILAADLGPMEERITAALARPIPQGAFDALCSFTFNIGLPGFLKSTTLRRLNAGDITEAAAAMMLWCKPPELRGRRTGERLQFLKAFATAAPVSAAPVPRPVTPRPGAAAKPPAAPAALPVPRKPEPATMKTKVPFLVALILALFGVSGANAAEIDFSPLVSAGIDYLVVPVVGALAAWVVAEFGRLISRIAGRYPAYLDQKTSDLLASNVSGVLDKAIAWGATQAHAQIGRSDPSVFRANVDGWIAGWAADYAVKHAPELMKQAGDVTEKIVARLGEHPAVLEVKALGVAAQPAA